VKGCLEYFFESERKISEYKLYLKKYDKRMNKGDNKAQKELFIEYVFIDFEHFVLLLKISYMYITSFEVGFNFYINTTTNRKIERK